MERTFNLGNGAMAVLFYTLIILDFQYPCGLDCARIFQYDSFTCQTNNASHHLRVCFLDSGFFGTHITHTHTP